jgi:hypothetical protein
MPHGNQFSSTLYFFTTSLGVKWMNFFPEYRFRSVSTYDEKHGRKETRDSAVSDGIQWLYKQFPKRKTITLIQQMAWS